MKCWYCGHDMIWGNDFSYEEMGVEDADGIMSTFTCSNCDCFAEFYHPLDEGDGE